MSSNRNNIVYSYIEEYMDKTHKKNDAFFEALRAYAEENHIYIVKSDVERFLRTLVSIHKPEQILEVGTAIGYSAMFLLESAGEDSFVTTIERDETVLAQAKENVEKRGLSDRVRFVFGDATEVLENLSGSFDFAFIDAAKGKSKDHFDKVLKNMHSGGVIVTDDVLYMGMTASDELATKKHITITRRLREYLDYLCSDDRFETVILPIGDGVAVTYIK
ncbi:MAG: O-methyltransferase [Clostridia bacterium]|nr:O-methyltransferase [Clostridia bacterium]